MVELSKILVSLVAWVIMGAGIFWGACVWYSIKVGMLDHDYNDAIAEFVNLLCDNILNVKSTDSAKDVMRMVSNLTGEPNWIGLLRMYLVWPDTMAKCQPKLKEAYETLKEKYGVRIKNSAT